MATLNTTRNPQYSDLDLNFRINPGTNDIARLVGANAIKQSIKNLVITNYYDRPFRSYIGGNATRFLFENLTPITTIFLQKAILETITNWEKRVNQVQVSVIDNPNNNSYTVNLKYTIINTLQPVTSTIVLYRLR